MHSDLYTVGVGEGGCRAPPLRFWRLTVSCDLTDAFLTLNGVDIFIFISAAVSVFSGISL